MPPYFTMPKKDGYETLDEIRALEHAGRWRPVPIIALTALPWEEVSRRCKAGTLNGGGWCKLTVFV